MKLCSTIKSLLICVFFAFIIYYQKHLKERQKYEEVWIKYQKNQKVPGFEERNSPKLINLINNKDDLSPNRGKKKTAEQQDLKTHPIILVWTTSSFIEEKGIEFYAEEQYGSCRLTMDRSTLKKSIAVVIFNNNLKFDPPDLPDPRTRDPNQAYVFWTTETPGKTVGFRKLLENGKVDPIFNLSMSLMKTADIQLRFGGYRKALENSKRWKFTTDKSSSLWRKTRLAIWAVSNCHRTPGATERLLYAKSLVKAGLKLDKFGECFDKERNSSGLLPLIKNYKFYLAFENSVHCPDYVTEKFWRNGIKAGLVPIVWGPTKQDVLDVAPPHSFIHAEDFTSPKELVKRLNYLDTNYTAYMEYHKWRDTPINEVPHENYASGHIELLSMLCRRLVKEKHAPKTIPSISKLLYDTGYADDKCLRKRNPYSAKIQNDAVNF